MNDRMTDARIAELRQHLNCPTTCSVRGAAFGELFAEVVALRARVGAVEQAPREPSEAAVSAGIDAIDAMTGLVGIRPEELRAAIKAAWRVDFGASVVSQEEQKP